VTSPPAGPLDGAARTRPGGWLATPLPTDPGAAVAQARILLARHHAAATGRLRCLTARYRSHTFSVGDPPRLIFKRHADQAAYLGEALAYQLLDGEGVLPELIAACDAALTLLTGYVPEPVDLRAPAAFEELIGAVARVHTAPARWHPAVAAATAAWRIGATAGGSAPDWICSPPAWRHTLELVAGAHGADHVPLGHLDLKSDHARRDADGRLIVIDAETLRPDLTGLPDLITLGHLAAETCCPRSPRWVRHAYLARANELGAQWVDPDLAAALRAWATATGLRSLHGLGD